MMLYKNKYRVESSRLIGWDYSSSGYYFVTICTKNMECCLGCVENAKIELSDLGKIVAEEWQKTEYIRGNVKCDEWIVMPNHLHGIVIIENPDTPVVVETPVNVETHSNASLLQQGVMQKNNLSNIIRGFKSAATKRIHIAGYSYFAWQPRFHDHIIRNDESLHNIREYIINNAVKWVLDKYHPNIKENNHLGRNLALQRLNGALM